MRSTLWVTLARVTWFSERHHIDTPSTGIAGRGCHRQPRRRKTARPVPVDLAARIAAMRGYGDRVACRITELVLDARDPELLARFWCEVLGYVELERDGASIEIGPPGAGFGGPQPTIVLSQADEPKAGKLRLHIDVNATDREQDDELERLLAAGARRVDIGQTGAEPWQVLADPEGNEFCLLRPRVPKV
jgi:hypothetical protein